MIDLNHLWAEPFPIAPHAIMALAALCLGLLQMYRSKGTASHRFIGYIWVALMTGVAVSALFIHTLNLWQGFSPIHLLIPITLFGLWRGIQAARAGDIARHKSIMTQLFLLALVVTGGFTLIPGRTMHSVLFGGG